jgi:ABC-type phosphate transport system substrate-binding protein
VITVNDSSYPYARQLRLYVNHDKVSPAAKEFVRFVQSNVGQRLLDQIGFVRRLETRVWTLPPP